MSHGIPEKGARWWGACGGAECPRCRPYLLPDGTTTNDGLDVEKAIDNPVGDDGQVGTCDSCGGLYFVIVRGYDEDYDGFRCGDCGHCAACCPHHIESGRLDA